MNLKSLLPDRGILTAFREKRDSYGEKSSVAILYIIGFLLIAGFVGALIMGVPFGVISTIYAVIAVVVIGTELVAWAKANTFLAVVIFLFGLGLAFAFVFGMDITSPPEKTVCEQALIRIGVTDSNISEHLGPAWPQTVSGLAELTGCSNLNNNTVTIFAAYTDVPGCEDAPFCTEAMNRANDQVSTLNRTVGTLDLSALIEVRTEYERADAEFTLERTTISTGAEFMFLLAIFVIGGLGLEIVFDVAVAKITHPAVGFISNVALAFGVYFVFWIVSQLPIMVPLKSTQVYTAIDSIFWTAFVLSLIIEFLESAILGMAISALGELPFMEAFSGYLSSVISTLATPLVVYFLVGGYIVDQLLISTSSLEKTGAYAAMMFGVLCFQQVHSAFNSVVRSMFG